MSAVLDIHYYKREGEEGEEYVEGPAATAFGQGTVITHKETGPVERGLLLLLRVGVHNLLLLFLDDGTKDKEGHRSTKDDYDDY